MSNLSSSFVRQSRKKRVPKARTFPAKLGLRLKPFAAFCIRLFRTDFYRALFWLLFLIFSFYTCLFLFGEKAGGESASLISIQTILDRGAFVLFLGGCLAFLFYLLFLRLPAKLLLALLLLGYFGSSFLSVLTQRKQVFSAGSVNYPTEGLLLRQLLIFVAVSLLLGFWLYRISGNGRKIPVIAAAAFSVLLLCAVCALLSQVNPIAALCLSPLLSLPAALLPLSAAVMYTSPGLQKRVLEYKLSAQLK